MKKIKFSQRVISAIVIFSMTMNPAIAAQRTAPLLVQEMQSRQQQAAAQRHAAATSQPVAAGRIVVDSSADRALQAGLKEASNGTSVVDITAPSTAGVSHNLFTEFNVDQQGVIFNNSLAPVLTQLGGWADGNRRLTGGQASIILNEVTGLSRSHLLGQVEIAGHAAEFVLANPNGISCNGCGFINTPRVTMVTGRPEMAGGSLQGFNVNGGDFTLDGAGLNASNIDRFDIVTRAATINAELHARKLNIYTGNNYFNYQTGELDAQIGISSEQAFQFALDVSALGAMYANSIQLIGTEKGLGVNSEGLIHSVNDLEISADGDIRLRNTQSNERISLTSQSGSLSLDERTYGRSIDLTAATAITNQGLLGAQEQISLNAERFDQQGQVYAGLGTQAELLESGNLQVNLQQDFRNAGDIYVGGELTLHASELNNTDGVINLASQEQLDIDGTLINQRGTLGFAAENARLSAQVLNNTAGQITHTGDGQLSLGINQALINAQGTIAAQSSLNLEAEQLDNTDGILVADTASIYAEVIDNSAGVIDTQQLSLTGTQLVNQEGKILARSEAQDALVLNITGTIDNHAGLIYAQASDINLQLDQLLNREGQLVAGTGAINLDVQQLDNQGGTVDAEQLSLSAELIDNSQGYLFAQQLTLDTARVTNHQGHIQADNIVINTQDYLSQGGVLLALGQEGESLSLNADRLENTEGAIIESRGERLQLIASELDNTGGNLLLTSQGRLDLQLDRLINRDGSIHAAQSLQLNTEHLDNQLGQLSAGQSLVLRTQDIDNSNGSIFSQGQLVLRARNVDNTAGLIDGTNLQLTLDRLINNEGRIQGDALSLSIPELNNRGGTIAAVNRNGKGLELQVAGVVDNTGGRLISEGREFVLNAGQVRNQDGEILAEQNLQLSTRNLNNTDGLISGQSLMLRATQIDNLQGGVIEGERLSLHADTLNNDGLVLATGTQSGSLGLNLLRINNAGRLETYSFDFLLDNIALHSDGGEILHHGEGVLRVQADGTFDNRGGALITHGQLDFQADAVDNRGGQLIAAGHLAIDIDAIHNQGGLIQSGNGLNLNLAEFDNSDGGRVVVGGERPAQIQVDGLSNNQSGAVIYWGQDLLTIVADILNNSAQGTLGGDGAIALQIAGELDNTGGNIIGGSQISVNAASLLNSDDGFIEARTLTVQVDELNNENSRIQAESLVIDTQSLNNRAGGEIISLGDVAQINAQQLTNQGALIYVSKDLSIQADSLHNESGVIEAGRLQIHSDSVNNLGLLAAYAQNESGLALYTRELTNQGRVENRGQHLLVNASEQLVNSGELIHSGHGNLQLTAPQLDNREGEILATRATLSVQAIDDQQGEIFAEESLSIDTQTIDNRTGLIQTAQALTLAAQSLDNTQGGRVIADTSAVSLNQLDNRAGLVAVGELNLSADQFDNRAGQILVDSLNLQLQQLDNRLGYIAATGDVEIAATEVSNQGGSLLAAGGLTLAADDLINDQQDDVLGILSADWIQLAFDAFDNREGGRLQANNVQLSGNVIDNGGLIASLSGQGESLQFAVSEINNAGRIESHGENLRFESMLLDNTSGEILHRGNGSFVLRLDQLSNHQGLIQTQGQGEIEVDQLDNTQGVIAATGNQLLILDIDQLDNSDGLIQAEELNINATALDNARGEVSASQLTMAAGQLDNRGGRVIGDQLQITATTLNNEQDADQQAYISGASVSITADTLNNRSYIQAENLQLEGAVLDNHEGSLLALANADTALSLNFSDSINNDLGIIDSRGGSVLTTDSLNNREGAINADGELLVSATDVDNSQGLIRTTSITDNALQLQVVNPLVNAGGTVETHAQNVSLDQLNIDNRAGKLLHMGSGVLAINGDNYTNDDGLIYSAGDMHFNLLGGLINEGTLAAAGLVQINTALFENRQQGLVDAGLLLLSADNSVNQGRIQVEDMAVQGDRFDNRAGELLIIGEHENALRLQVDEFDNRDSGRIEIHSGSLTLDTAINNQGGRILHLGEGVLRLTQVDNRAGEIYATGNLDIEQNDLDNSLGYVHAEGLLNLQLNSLINQGGTLYGQSLHVVTNTLDNTQAGKIVSDQTFNLIATESLDNSGGTLLSHATDMHIAGGELNNRTGNITHRGTGELQLDFGSELDNTAGRILSEGSLTLALDHLINRGEADTAAVIAARELSITATSLDNRDGQLQASEFLSLNLPEINNQGGRIVSLNTADHALNLITQYFDNRAGGVLEVHSQNLDVSELALDNRGGALFHLGEGVLSIIDNERELLNENGRIQSAGNVDILQQAIDNRGGLIQGNLVAISAGETIDNSLQGQLLGQSLTLTADALNNTQQGLVAGLGNRDDSLVMNIAALDNSGGTLRSGADQWLLNLDSILNTGGSIIHTGTQQLSLSSAHLLSTSGSIISLADINLSANGINNEGSLIAEGNLTLVSDAGVTNTSTGLLQAGADVAMTIAGDLSNQGGIAAMLGLDLSIDGLFNNSGLLTTSAASARIETQGLTNTGTLAHNGEGNLVLDTTSLTNSGDALLKTNGSLMLNANQISNSAAISAAHLEASGFDQLQNLAGGQLEAGSADLQGDTLTNQGNFTVVNSGNSLVWDLAAVNNSGSLTLGSTNLSFSGDLTNSGSLTHAGNGTLALGNSGSVNVQGGSIATAGTANLSGNLAGAGELFARLGIQIGGMGTFNNKSDLYTQGNLTVNSALNNQSGQMIAQGTLSVNTAGSIKNSGHLQGGNLQLNAGTLTNTSGRIVATGTGTSSLVASQINNTGGSITASNNQLTLRSTQGSIDNTGGTIFHQGAGTFTLSAADDVINGTGSTITSLGSLALTAADQLTNQGLLRANQLNLSAAQLSNAGDIFGFGAADIINAGNVANTGTIQGNGLNLSLNAATQLNNTGGTIEHTGPGTLLISAPNLLNATQQSVIKSNGDIEIATQGHFFNSGEISSENLTQIHDVSALTNHHMITSRQGDVDLKMAGTLTNSGTISGLARTGIESTTISNTGSIQSDGLVELTLDALSQTGNVSAGNELSLNVTQSITINNGETLSTNGILSLNTEGDITNSGTLSATNAIRLSGNNLYNHYEILGGGVSGTSEGDSSLNFNGDIINHHQIGASGDLMVLAGNVVNHGSIATGGSLNFSVDGDIANHNGNTIFAGGNLVLGAGGTINNDGGTLFAVDNLAMRGHDFRDPTSRSQQVINTNGQIEAFGNLSIFTNELNNIRTGVSYQLGATTNTTVLDEIPYRTWSGSISLLDNPHGAGLHEDRYERTTVSTTYVPTAAGSDAKIASGGNMSLNTGSGVLLNQYGTIASGNVLSINGAGLENHAYVAQRHDDVTVVTRRDWIHGPDTGFQCPWVGCVEYFDEDSNGDYGWSEQGIEYLDTAMGTISAANGINGNLSGSLVTRIVSPLGTSLGDPEFRELGAYAAGTQPEDAGQPGVVPNGANRGTNASGAGNPSGSLGSQSGNAQNTNGQGFAHGGTVAGPDGNTDGHTNPNDQIIERSELYQAIGPLDVNERPSGLDQNGFDAEGETYTGENVADVRKALLALVGTGTMGDFTAEHIAARTEAERLEAQNSGATAPDANAPGSTNPDAASLVDGLNQHALDNGALNDGSERTADGSGENPSGNTEAPASADVVQADPTPPAPYAVNLSPGSLNPGQLGGLFVYNNAPTGNYLIETRSEFTDYTKFLGSDYLLNALGYDPEKTLKRLGDAFYENQLIRDAMRREVGTQYLAGAANDYEQMKLLMDNAVAAGKSLQLRVGIALSATQVAALTQDIVWLVEQVVNGQKVLVPTLYVASIAQNKLPAGVLIASGGGINLHAAEGIDLQGKVSAAGLMQLTTDGHFQVQQNAQLSAAQMYLESTVGNFDQLGSLSADHMSLNAGGNFNNLGTLRADTGLWVKAGDELINHNSGQMVSGGVLSLTATNDLINRQGYLEGVDVFLKSETGNIVNRTEFEQVTTRYGTSTVVGDRSTIISHNSLSMDAGNNLDLQGSKFNAANDISFTAGNDILLNAIENTRSSSVTGKTSIEHSNTTWDGVSITAGNNLTLSAGRDIQAPGASLTAGNNASLSAGRDVNLLALANTNHLEISAKRKKIIDTEVVHTLASVNAGGNASITAGQDANLIGATVAAGGNVALHAERDTNLVAVNDSDYHYDYTKKKRSFGRSTTTENETLKENVVGGIIQADGNVLINARGTEEGLITLDSGKVNIVGGQVTAGKHVVISADEDINITASTYNELDYHSKSKSGLGGLSKKNEGGVEENTLLNMAFIGAGSEGNAGSVNFMSSNNIALIGAQVVADGDINIEAVDQLLISAGEVLTRSESWKESSGMFTGGDLYAKKESRAGEAVTSAEASVLDAGGRVNAHAGSGKIIGSDIHGEQGVSITTDIGDIELLAAKSGSESYSYDKSVTVGLGDLLASDPSKIIQNKDGRLTMTFADATYDEVDSKTRITDMRSVQVTTGEGDIRFDSANNIHIEGSHLAAGINNEEASAGDVILLAVNDVTIKEATNTYDEETKEVHGSAEMSVVVQHQAVEVAKAAIAADEAKNQLEQAKKDFKQYERDVDNLGTTLAAMEADYKNKVPGVNYADILELRELLNDVKGDKEWYVAGVVLAAANVTAKVTALAQQSAAAAQSAGTYGFNAGVQLDIDASKSDTTLKETTAVASTISGNNIRIQTGSGKESTSGTTTTIQGSHLNASGTMDVNTGELNILASRDTREYSNESEQAHITAQMTVYGASGGASINADYSRSKAGETSTTVNNSTLTADKLNITTVGDTNIRGGNVHAESELNADIRGDLNVESQQDRHRSKNNSVGISAGMSFGGTEDSGKKKNADGSDNHNQGFGDIGGASGVNAGLNASNGMSITKETVLSSFTSGGTATINVKGNTQITGALIATIDDEGNDLGKLNLSTGSLSFTDLTDIHQSSQTSGSISTSIGLGAAPQLAKDDEGREMDINTTNITYSNTSQYDAGKSLATLGGGNVTVGGVELEKDGELTEAGLTDGSPLDRLNRDTTNLNKDLWNVERKEGDVDLQIDHRMFSAEGRREIRQQVEMLPQNLEVVANNLLQDIETLTDPYSGQRKADNEVIMALVRERLEKLSPEEREQVMQTVGVFIDGTGNDKDKDTAHDKQTNVAILNDLYESENNPLYYAGVATEWYSGILCGITGCGGQARINNALKDIGAKWGGDDKVLVIDVTGFSRGAAQSLELINSILKDGIPGVPQEKIVINGAYLFDTVGSTGIPGNSVDASYDLSSSLVVPVFHATAENEYRNMFDLQSQLNSDGTSPANVAEKGFLGAHSDIGRGYAAGEDGKKNTLSTIPLNWMHKNALENGAPLAPIPTEYLVPPELQILYEAAESGDQDAMQQLENDYIHDSRYAWERWFNDSERTIYYPNGD